MNGKTVVFLCLTTVLMYCTTGVYSESVCEQPKIVGLCKAAFRRWYYNSRINQCTQFIYGGCGGNGNNFRTKADCVNRCICDLPKKVGPCKARIPRWYYTKSTRRCQRFYWGGCQANGNNFMTRIACRKTC